MRLLAIAAAVLSVGCTSVEEKREYRQAQVDMIKVQQQSKEAIALQREQAQAQMWAAAAEIVKANPESAGAFAVVMGVRVASEDNQDDAPLVTLQREENEALAVVKAVAPSLITTLGTVGVAALQADVNKTQSDNAALVAIADSTTDADIMRSVTGMAVAGLQNGGVRVNGNYLMADTIDQSSTTDIADSYNQTTTSEFSSTTTVTRTDSQDNDTITSGDTVSDSYNTSEQYAETNSETNSVTDSYNETSSVADSYNTSETTTNTETNTTTETTTMDSYNTYQTPEGSLVSYEDLQALLAAGIRVTVVIDGEEVEVEQANCPDGSDGLTFGGGEAVCE